MFFSSCWFTLFIQFFFLCSRLFHCMCARVCFLALAIYFICTFGEDLVVLTLDLCRWLFIFCIRCFFEGIFFSLFFPFLVRCFCCRCEFECIKSQVKLFEYNLSNKWVRRIRDRFFCNLLNTIQNAKHCTMNKQFRPCFASIFRHFLGKFTMKKTVACAITVGLFLFVRLLPSSCSLAHTAHAAVNGSYWVENLMVYAEQNELRYSKWRLLCVFALSNRLLLNAHTRDLIKMCESMTIITLRLDKYLPIEYFNECYFARWTHLIQSESADVYWLLHWIDENQF